MEPYTPLRSVKYLRFTPKNIPNGGPIKVKKPALEASLNVAKPSSSTKIRSKSMSWKIMVILFQGIKREKMAIKKRRIKSAKSDAAEKGRTYSIDSLNLAGTIY